MLGVISEMESSYLDVFFTIAFIVAGIFGFLFFAVYWKPVLIFFIIMLTALEPKVGIPAAFFGSFTLLIWFERKQFSKKMLLDALKFSFYMTLAAIVIGFVLDTAFSGSSGGYGGCSRATPYGC